MELYCICPTVTGLFHIAEDLKAQPCGSMFQHAVPLEDWVTFHCMCTHLLMDLWVVSAFETYRYSCCENGCTNTSLKTLFSFGSCFLLELHVRFFEGIMLFQNSCPIHIPTNSVPGFKFVHILDDMCPQYPCSVTVRCITRHRSAGNGPSMIKQ